MASLGSWQKLPALSSRTGKPFIQYLSDRDILLCTSGQKHVDVCHCSDGKSKQTWSVRESQHLTSHAVCYPKTSDYFVVVNKKTLYQWTESNTEIVK